MEKKKPQMDFPKPGKRQKRTKVGDQGQEHGENGGNRIL